MGKRITTRIVIIVITVILRIRVVIVIEGASEYGPVFFVQNERFLACSQGCVSTRYDKVVLLLVNADLVCGDILAVTGPHALIYALMDGRPDTSIPLTSRCPKPSLTSCNNEVVPSSDMFDV